MHCTNCLLSGDSELGGGCVVHLAVRVLAPTLPIADSYRGDGQEVIHSSHFIRTRTHTLSLPKVTL